MTKPKIVVLCGSSRFVDIMAVCAWLIEREEQAISSGLHLLPDWYSAEDIPSHLAEHEGVAEQMDELHKRKIDLAAEIFVVNYQDYIGDSTKSEIAYAKSKRVPIRWFTHDPIGAAVIELMLAAANRHAAKRKCRECGCTDEDCRQCLEKTGQPCCWVERDLCSACQDESIDDAVEDLLP